MNSSFSYKHLILLCIASVLHSNILHAHSRRVSRTHTALFHFIARETRDSSNCIDPRLPDCICYFGNRAKAESTEIKVSRGIGVHHFLKFSNVSAEAIYYNKYRLSQLRNYGFLVILCDPRRHRLEISKTKLIGRRLTGECCDPPGATARPECAERTSRAPPPPRTGKVIFK